MAEKVQQMHIIVDSSAGTLEELANRIRQAGVKVYTLLPWEENNKGHLLAVTNDSAAASANLGDVIIECSEEEALYVELGQAPCALHTIARILTEAGIAIQLVYAATGQPDRKGVILVTSDNDQAAGLV